MGEGVKKSNWFFFTSFRRKPESSVFKALRTDWTPVFTGETAENQFFHTFGGRVRVGVIMSRNFRAFYVYLPHPAPLPPGEREFPDGH